MMLRFIGSGCLWLAGCTSAAYVQWQHCGATSPDNTALIPQSLSARVEHINGTHDRLVLGVSRQVDEAQCPRLIRVASGATLDIQMLGHHSSHQLDSEGTCRSTAWSKGRSTLELTLVEDIAAFYPLSAFGVTVKLDDDIFGKESCIRAIITPGIDSQSRALLTYVPLAVFLFVLLAGFIRSAYGNSSATDDVDAEEVEPRSIFPDVGDCLHYLQFVFLTGSLSLFYPGFYQPTVSHFSLYSLFSRGIIRPDWQYEGVSDGIYVVNGTYGGTFGLELMTQIVGAPLTWGTWMNMILSIAIIALAAAVVLEIYRFMNHASRPDRHYSPWAGLRHTSNHVFRGVLSYFMLPLVALTSYQLDNAGILPAYHTSLAVFFIVIIIIMFAWLLRQIPTRSLGILIFDNSRRYRQVPMAETSPTQEKSFVLVLFLLSFIRGVAVGGLQISATAQLVVLVLCELILLASIAGLQTYSIFSIGTTSAATRLCSLLLMVAFIPGIGTGKAKVVIGYVILLMHACMLIFGFPVPVAYSLVKLLAARRKAPRPSQVYGLRQLRRRHNSRNDLSENCSVSPVEAGMPKETLGQRSHPRLPPGEPNAIYHNLPATSNRYYRPPRISRSDASILSSRHLGITPPVSPTVGMSVSDSTASPIRHYIGQQDLSYGTRASSSTDPRNSSSESSGDMPLGPRWGDYSFREADLFYGAPHPNPHGAVLEGPPSVSPRPTLSPLRLWTKFNGSQPNKKSFQVVRPALNHPGSHNVNLRSSGHQSLDRDSHQDKDGPKE